MTPVLKSFLKALAFAYLSCFAGWLCGWPLVGLYVGAVPVMVSALWMWDRAHELAKECWVCGRSEMYGRHMMMADWFKSGDDPHGICGHCGGKLVKKGDRLYGHGMGGAKTA